MLLLQSKNDRERRNRCSLIASATDPCKIEVAINFICIRA